MARYSSARGPDAAFQMIEYTGFHFCPRCGRGSLRDFGEKAVQCGECGYLYFHNAAAAVAGIIETSGGILLTRRNEDPSKDKLDLPGGFVDYGESFEAALQREVREELNLNLSDLRYFGSFPNTYVYQNITYFTSDAVFTCRAVVGSEISLNREIADAVIVKPDEIDFGQVGFESARAILNEYLKRFNRETV
jgi:NADH pyrophosphatase NudC (nudix superfamily)